MAFGTKYRIEFKDILDLFWRVDIDTDGYFGTSAPVTSWPEYSNYDTYITSGYNITSAIMTTGDASEAYSNYFDCYSGDPVTVNINLTLTSGDAPDIYLVNSLDATKSNVVTLSAGVNSVTLIPTASGNFRLKLYTTGNTNFAITIAYFINNIIATGEPLNIEMLNNGDDWSTAPVHGSKAKIGVYSTTDFQWLELSDYGNMTYRVSVYYGNSLTLYWRGFIYSDGYEEGYDMPPYPVSILANDGLGLLKNKPFKYTISTEDDTYYTFRQTESYIITQILSKIGFTSWKEFVNIYESTMANGVGDSPFVQTCIDVDIFRDLNCYEVLERILTKYNAVICQDRGELIIYRPEEINQGTIYGRSFTDVDVYSPISMSPEQWVNRSGTPSSFIIPEGGTLSLKTPLKKITINQDYGSKKSWLDNYQFAEETWNQSTEQFDDWTRLGIAGPWSKASSIIKTEKDGIGMLPSATVPDTTKSVYQEFGIYAIPTDNIVNLSISYRLVNADTSTNAVVPLYAKLVNVAGTHWAKMAPADTVASWDTSLQYLNWEEKDVKVGESDWITKTLSIAGLPAYGPYYLYLYSTEYTIYMIVKDICFYATADEVIRKAKRKSRWSFSPWWTFALGIGSAQYQISGKRKITGYSYTKGDDNEEIVEKEYTVTNAIKGNDVTNDYTLGDVIETNIDNILEQFQGALSFKTLTNAATKFIIDWAATYLSGEVIVTSSGKNIILTAQTAGVDFTGSTTITNVIGDLSGTVVHTQANVVGQSQITDVTFAGTSGSIEIMVDDTNGYESHVMTYSASISASITNFIASYGSLYAAIGVTLTHPSTNVMRMTSTMGLNFDVTLLPSGITGTPNTTQNAIAPVARIDTITLSGTNGTANILCDGITKLCSMTDTNSSGLWNSRQYGTENKPLLEIAGDSIRKQYSRPTHLLSLPMIEKYYTTNEPQLRLSYNMRDILNQDPIAADARYFFINGAEFEVVNRQWKLDLVEIVTTE